MEQNWESLATGLGVLEGPVVCRDGSIVVTSIDQGRVYRLRDGHTAVAGETGGGPNGATEDADGLLFVAQNGGAAPALNDIASAAGVQIIRGDGAIELFGREMRAPNDLCFGPDGFLYVTDPTRKPERDDGRIWKCDVRTGECEMLFACDWYPNGIGFSPDDEFVYVADSRHRRIVRFPLEKPSLDAVETYAVMPHGIPDGFAFDDEGTLLVACPSFDGPGDVQVYRDGQFERAIRPGSSKLYLNLAISGDGRLIVCDADRGEVLASGWTRPGLALHPFR